MRILKIDVTKLNKEFFFKGKQAKDGHVPIYADLVIHDNKDGVDQYGNSCFVTQGVTKEARLRGERGDIVGNGRDVRANNGESMKSNAPTRTIQSNPSSNVDEDVPF